MDTVSLGLKFEIWKSVQHVYKFTFLIGKCQNRACHTIQRHLPTGKSPLRRGIRHHLSGKKLVNLVKRSLTHLDGFVCHDEVKLASKSFNMFLREMV